MHERRNGVLSAMQNLWASNKHDTTPSEKVSLASYLQLELSSERPSALYDDFPYESSQVKFERLLNFLLIPPHLEHVLLFGAVACLDAWLYTFTILPLRFLKALWILGQWIARNAASEVHDVGTFVYSGVGRVWQRRRQSSVSGSRRPSFAEFGQSRKLSVSDVGAEPTARASGPKTPATPGMPAANRPARLSVPDEAADAAVEANSSTTTSMPVSSIDRSKDLALSDAAAEEPAKANGSITTALPVLDKDTNSGFEANGSTTPSMPPTCSDTPRNLAVSDRPAEESAKVNGSITTALHTPDLVIRRSVSVPDIGAETGSKPNGSTSPAFSHKKRKIPSVLRHRRTKSTPSALLPNHKADILQGLLILGSCTVLMWFDASRMYHSIRGQAAIKLYVIYNVLEVFDRLFSALGQDVLECLFSKETLERNEHGRSKILRPFWMFLLALVYNVIHATALFYQVITLNVAVNSYSNALLTLLMSNQFVEIKGTVFKKFEKENLFQITCADVVERFQLWLMLFIIALRNMVEVGGLSISINTAFSGPTSPADTLAANATGIPLSSGFIMPKAFTILPAWTGEVLGPFIIVLGSEALVDWCKHAYITKFNNVKPNIYGRFLDVLAKDYYTHAFANQNPGGLTRRLGLPILPLSCLFIRACIQTYKMFLATHMPMPLASSTIISVESEAAATSPATTAALQHIDHIFRRALGRTSFGAGASSPAATFTWWSIDYIIACATMAFFFLALYLILLAMKLVLGMALLSFSRSRSKGMKERERQPVDAKGKWVGGWQVTQVNDEQRQRIYEDDLDGLRAMRERDERGRKKGEMKLDSVQRYTMAAKRIW